MIFAAVSLMLMAVNVYAGNIGVKEFRYSGPHFIQAPFLVDSTNIDGKAYKAQSILDRPMNLDAVKNAAFVSSIPSFEGEALHLLSFCVEASAYAKADIKVEGVKNWKLYKDGSKCTGSGIEMEPATYNFVLKIWADKAQCDSLRISVESGRDNVLSLRNDGTRLLSLDIDTDGLSCGGLSISYSGKYACLGSKTVLPGGKTVNSYEVIRLKDGFVCARPASRVAWMADRDEYYYTRETATGRDLLCFNPETGAETLLAAGIPEGRFTISPNMEYLVYSMMQEGPKEGDVHQIIAPDDRQPGWRNRSYIAIYDIKSGILRPLTYGFHNSYLSDISDDGKTILFATSRERLTQRPTTLSSYYTLDVATGSVKEVISDDGFINSVSFSPDAKSLLITASGQAFDSIGADVKEGQIPNMYHVMLYTKDLQSGQVKCLTKEFGPSMLDARWSRADGKIYFSAENKDCKNLFRTDASGKNIEKIELPQEYLYGFDMATTSPALVCYAQGLETADKAYLVDTKKMRTTLLRDFSAQRLENVRTGQGGAFEFTSRNGDNINCFYVLPPDFDQNKSYPMLVHYYGGCSPTARYCIGSYSPQYYAAQGYVFLVVNPSGAAGMGQEFAARHVNTAGDVVADDIIEATEKFCQSHPFVDKKHIGCFSASYGGFMTQLLLITTDLFATGISHAGISDHTSYWGEGYWGYSYSECSMAESYPWTRKDLYVDRSPLYNADKINTPLLFLHGSADTNVPIGESIQMFTALKLLGRETAFVVVDGENHGITDYKKKRQWLRTISAWFAKYLKEDSAWWDSLYPQKNL